MLLSLVPCGSLSHMTFECCCSRTSFFGGAVSTRDDVMIGKKHWYDEHRRKLARGCRDLAGLGEGTVTVKKKSIVPSSYPVNGGQCSTSCSSGRNTNENLTPGTQRMVGGKLKVQPKQRGACAIRRQRKPLSEQNKSTIPKKELHDDPVGTKEKLVKRRGTFYGQAQPPSALQPIPQRPSYSVESDIESLIDDNDVDSEDVAWVGELMNTLGSYATKDFSKIDKQRDYRMQASFDQIMEEEHQTAKIGLEVDVREAARARRKRQRHPKTEGCRNLVLCSSSDDEE